MSKLIGNAKVRLAARAVFVGIVVAAHEWVNGEFSDAAIQGAILAGLLAAFEILTPANPLVGLFKKEA